MNTHAILAPSSAPIWGFCSGSVPAQMSAPNLDTQQSREGNAAHWVGAECLTNWKQPGAQGLLCSQWLGKIDPQGVVIDSKMVEGAQVYVDDVLAVAQEHGALQSMRIEHHVSMPQIHPLNDGTLDLSIVLLDKGVVYLWDYKHGFMEVEAFANLQMVDYLAGLMEELNINGHMQQFIRFVIRIVQPYSYRAAGPIDEWTGTLSDLRGYIDQLTVQADEAITHPTFTGGKHCRNCTAVGTCATARRYIYSFLDYVKEPYCIDSMDGKSLAVERDILKSGFSVAKSRLEAVEDELVHRIKGGDSTTGFTLETTQGKKVWSVPTAQAVALAAQFGADISKNDVLTPTQAIAAIDVNVRRHFEKTIIGVTTRNAGTFKLINADKSLTARAFGKRR